MDPFIMALTKFAGYAMLVLQLTLGLGNLYLKRYDSALYWFGGVLLTTGALRMGGAL